MPIAKLNIDEFITFAAANPVIDVRSPGEFAQAHIPNAFSLPIFNDEERKIIGTAYKQESREKAIKLGLNFFGKDMVKMVEVVEKLIAGKRSASRDIGVHCWRGGMRSGAMAWLLDLYGFKVHLLSGGYKAYRKWALQQFEKNHSLLIVGGYSGSDKTGILTELKKNGEAVIDLENIAGHQGSAFGNLELAQQPTQEHFENLLAYELHLLGHLPGPVWVEAESQRLGNVNIPLPFLNTMLASPVFFLNIPFEKRLAHIVQGYGSYPKDRIVNGIMRIKKRLGGLETKTAINFLLEDDLPGCFAVLLKYYDKGYLKSTLNRDNVEQLITYIDSDTLDRILNMEKIKHHVRSTR
jgi:tRNA 2-selenouridine synthase